MSEKNELEILCPEIEIYGYKLKPWGLKELAGLSPVLYILKSEIKAKGVNITNLFDLDEIPKGQSKTEREKKIKDTQNAMIEGIFDLGTSVFPYIEDIFDLGTSVFPYIAQIISVTSGMSKDEADNLSLDKAMVFILTIVEQNLSFLKNCFGLVAEKIESLKIQL